MNTTITITTTTTTESANICAVLEENGLVDEWKVDLLNIWVTTSQELLVLFYLLAS